MIPSKSMAIVQVKGQVHAHAPHTFRSQGPRCVCSARVPPRGLDIVWYVFQSLLLRLKTLLIACRYIHLSQGPPCIKSDTTVLNVDFYSEARLFSTASISIFSPLLLSPPWLFILTFLFLIFISVIATVVGVLSEYVETPRDCRRVAVNTLASLSEVLYLGDQVSGLFSTFVLTR